MGSGRHMRTRDRISVAALVVSVATLVAVVVTPAPSAPVKGAGFSSQRMLLSAAAEKRAVLQDRDTLDGLDRRVGPLQKRSAAETSPGSDEGDVVRAEVERELSRRWKEFERRLREMRK